MPIFEHHFTVNGPLARVVNFHRDPHILKRLTPPPLIIQIHRFEPLAEGSIADFTLWFGPLPIHWVAVHQNVDFPHSFTDIQREGPLKSWRHTHSFIPISDNLTRVNDVIEFEHEAGPKGLLSRLLFPKSALKTLFFYRQAVTRYMVEASAANN
ncbi:MAG TPA: SRPBCC family protein [Anaerolineae bacterium]|nr:SRPBCC family protein [Anaerolineae bacterium]HRV91503.1 SRPBCC family protein [Anaerolineae bacterium]